MDVYHALLSATDRRFLVHLAIGDCSPHMAGSPCAGGDLDKFLAAEGPRIGLIVYAQAGFRLALDPDGDVANRQLFAPVRTGEPLVDGAAIGHAMAVLETFAAHAPVVWLGPRIEPHVPVETILGLGCDRIRDELDLRPWHAAFFARLDGDLTERTLGAAFDYVSEQAAVGFDIRRDLYDCGHLYWSDADHWTPDGEAMFGARIAPVLSRLFEEKVRRAN